jgi:hypothetical protein
MILDEIENFNQFSKNDFSLKYWDKFRRFFTVESAIISLGIKHERD